MFLMYQSKLLQPSFSRRATLSLMSPASDMSITCGTRFATRSNLVMGLRCLTDIENYEPISRSGPRLSRTLPMQHQYPCSTLPVQ